MRAIINKSISFLRSLRVYKKLKFVSIVRKHLLENKIEVYDEYDWYKLKERTVTYVGFTLFINVSSIYNLFTVNGYYKNIRLIKTDHLNCVCFENDQGLLGLILSLKESFMSIDQETFNQSRNKIILDEIINYCESNNINSLKWIDEYTVALIRFAEYKILAVIHNLPYKEVVIQFTLNTHKEIKRYYLDFIEHATYNESLDHIVNFCRIYYWVIRTISELIPSVTPITFHDVGTSTGQFPLLLSALSQEKLLGLNIEKIIASDNGWMANLEIDEIINRNPQYKKIDFITLDIVKQIEKIPPADVTIAIDVLEHLKNDEVCLKSLSALWRQTKKVLVIHVPFESELNKGWGHNVIFDSAKLRRWLLCLPDAKLISDKYFEHDNTALLDHGYLIAVKGK